MPKDAPPKTTWLQELLEEQGGMEHAEATIAGALARMRAQEIRDRLQELQRLLSIANPEETARIMVKHNPALNYDTTLAQWRQAIKSIETPYEKKNGYGVATEERMQHTIDLVKTAMKIDTTLKAPDIYVPVVKGR